MESLRVGCLLSRIVTLGNGSSFRSLLEEHPSKTQGDRCTASAASPTPIRQFPYSTRTGAIAGRSSRLVSLIRPALVRAQMAMATIVHYYGWLLVFARLCCCLRKLVVLIWECWWCLCDCSLQDKVRPLFCLAGQAMQDASQRPGGKAGEAIKGSKGRSCFLTWPFSSSFLCTASSGICLACVVLASSAG